MRRAKSDAEQRRVGAVSGDSATVKVGSIVNYVGQHLLVLVDILLVFYFMFDLPAELLEDSRISPQQQLLLCTPDPPPSPVTLPANAVEGGAAQCRRV